MKTEEVIKAMNDAVDSYGKLVTEYPDKLEYIVASTIAAAAHDLGIILSNIERKLDDN